MKKSYEEDFSNLGKIWNASNADSRLLTKDITLMTMNEAVVRAG